MLDSQKQLEDFVKEGEAQAKKSWNNRGGFLKALTEAKVNYRKESLILIRHTERSGSIVVRFARPKLEGEKLVCTIQRDVPYECTDDMAEYCFAVAVDKVTVKQIEVWVSTKGADKPDKPRDIILVAAK